MEIVFITPEITPYSRTGPIGDVCAALPRGLRGMDHKVTVISPLWAGVDATAHALARRLSTIPVELAGAGDDEEASTAEMTVFDGRTTGGVDLVFIGNDALLEGPPPAQGKAASAEQIRAAVAFGQAAIAVAKERSDAVDVVHGHGWFAAPALADAREALPDARRVLSLHDPSARGELDGASAVGLPTELQALARGGDDSSLLHAGASVAQRVIASSQSAVEALQTDRHLADALDEAGKLAGIAAGLDASRWNPVTDALVPARFDPVDLTGKQRCKDALQYEVGLPVRPEVPLLFAVADTRIGDLLPSLDALLRNDVQLVVQSASGEALEQLDKLAEEHAERLALLEDEDERALHRAIAAADGLIVTGEDPISTELHLSGQRYGALPIAPSIGAVADGVVDSDANLETGNGFLYELGDQAALLSAIQRSLAAYSNTEGWARLRTRAMKLDLSWERAARRYEHAYR